MKRYLIIFVLFICSVAVLFGQEPKDDPNVMWTYKWTNFSTYPAVHPNGNVIIGDGSNGDVIEINGLTGELVRRIPIQTSDDIAISTDGTRLLINTQVIDYESLEVINDKVPNGLYKQFLNPRNDMIVMKMSMGIVTFDLNDNKITEYSIISNDYSTGAMKVSQDGKYLALGQRDFEDDEFNDYYTHFYLYDAQTMKLIRELEDVISEGRTIETIQFSENSKYVVYGQLHSNGSPKTTFFTCEPPFTKLEIRTETTSKDSFRGVDFIDNNYLYLSYIDGKSEDFYAVIYDIVNKKFIYNTDTYYSYYPLYNFKYNSIIIGGWASLSFDKILHGVGVQEPNNPIINLNVHYQSGLLKIRDYEPISQHITLSISDTLGNIVFNNPIIATNSIIEVPIVLPSGTYILQIQDGQNHHSQKFIVVN